MIEERALTTRQEFTPDQLELIKRTIAPKTTDDEFALFIMQCKRTGLDPFSRQIYAVKRWSSREQKEIMTIQTGIDGYRVLAERTQTYAPGSEPTFTYNEDGSLESATAHGWKLVAGRWFEVLATARYTEYVQKDRDGNPTSFWENMTHNQLAKCAEALLIRKCCPYDTSGIYTDVEMEQAENPVVRAGKPPPTRATPLAPPAPEASAEAKVEKPLPPAPQAKSRPTGPIPAENIGAAFKRLGDLASGVDMPTADYDQLLIPLRVKVQDGNATWEDFYAAAEVIRAWQPAEEPAPVVDPRD